MHIHTRLGSALFMWMGGSILTSLYAFLSCWVLWEQYEEQGPHIMYCKSMV